MTIKIIIFFLLFFIPNSYAEWIDVKPLRKSSDDSTLADVESHMTLKNIYQNKNDLINSCHEQIHGLNSKIRTSNKKEIGLYMLNDKAFVIAKHPNITLKFVADNVPTGRRGGIYKLYLVEQTKYWNKQPLYILDECVAYLHGTSTAIDEQNKLRGTESFLKCMQLHYYGKICEKLSKDTDYEYKNELGEILGVLSNRIRFISDHMDKLGWINSEHKYWLQLL